MEAWGWSGGEEFGLSGTNMEDAILSPRTGLIVQSWTWSIDLHVERGEAGTVQEATVRSLVSGDVDLTLAGPVG